MSSPFTSYSHQPARRPPYQVRPAPAVYRPYVPPTQARPTGHPVLIVLAVVVGVPAALITLLGMIVTGVTIPLIVAALITFLALRPRRQPGGRRR